MAFDTQLAAGKEDGTECMICAKTKPEEGWTEKPEKPDEFYDFLPGLGYEWDVLCSRNCVRKWNKYNLTYHTLKKLKVLSNMDQWQFQEIFEWPEEGGYADEKFRKFRMDPLGFLFTCDLNNQLKITKIKLKWIGAIHCKPLRPFWLVAP